MVTFPLIELQFTTICLSLSTVKTDTACSQIHTHTHTFPTCCTLIYQTCHQTELCLAWRANSHPSHQSLLCSVDYDSTSKQGVKLENNWSQCTECYEKKINSQGSENKSHTKPNVSTKNQKISITKHRWFMAITRHHRWRLDRMGPKWTTLSSVLLLRHY